MEQELKQRLIGVTIIVALVVIFVPMLFDKSGDRTAGTPDGIPPIPEDVVERKSIELPKSADDMVEEEKEKDTIPESGYKIIPLTDEPTPAAQPKAAGKAKTAVADAEPMGVTDEEPMDEDDVPASRAQPLGEEIPPASSPKAAKTEKVAPPQEARKPKPEAPPPESQQKKADTAAAKPKTAAVKTPVPAVKPTPVPEARAGKPEAAAGRPTPLASAAAKPGEANVPSAWVVQTGSFTTEAKAVALVEKLRQSRYPAFVERVQGDSGTIYRVKVGPELERARAEQTQKQIETNVGIKGIIVPQR